MVDEKGQGQMNIIIFNDVVIIQHKTVGVEAASASKSLIRSVIPLPAGVDW